SAARCSPIATGFCRSWNAASPMKQSWPMRWTSSRRRLRAELTRRAPVDLAVEYQAHLARPADVAVLSVGSADDVAGHSAGGAIAAGGLRGGRRARPAARTDVCSTCTYGRSP